MSTSAGSELNSKVISCLLQVKFYCSMSRVTTTGQALPCSAPLNYQQNLLFHVSHLCSVKMEIGSLELCIPLRVYTPYSSWHMFGYFLRTSSYP